MTTSFRSMLSGLVLLGVGARGGFRAPAARSTLAPARVSTGEGTPRPRPRRKHLGFLPAIGEETRSSFRGSPTAAIWDPSSGRASTRDRSGSGRIPSPADTSSAEPGPSARAPTRRTITRSSAQRTGTGRGWYGYASGIESLRFFGFGNKTGDGGDSKSDFFKARQEQYPFTPTLSIPLFRSLTLHA